MASKEISTLNKKKYLGIFLIVLIVSIGFLLIQKSDHNKKVLGVEVISKFNQENKGGYISDQVIKLNGINSIFGRPLIVHGDRSNLLRQIHQSAISAAGSLISPMKIINANSKK